MNLAAVAGVGIVAAAIAVLLKKHHPEYSVLITIVAGAMILVMVAGALTPVLKTVSGFVESAGMPAEYGGIVFKSLGVCLITQLAADSCRDAGQSSIAGRIELAGKAAILIVSLPLFEKIADLATTLIKV